MSISSSMKVEMVYQNNQQSLAKVRQELERIFTVGQRALEEAGAPQLDVKSYNEAVQAARQLHDILNRSFDNDLGVTNIAKFRAELEKSGLNLQTVYRDLSKIGSEGQKAFRDMAASIATSNIQLQKTTGFLDKMATTFLNTIRWSVATTVLNGVTDSLSNAVNYVEKLDTSLNNIRVVTGKSAEDMSTFAKEANKAAQELGASTRDITEGALIFYQQGDTDADAMYKAQVTQKLTNVSTDLDADEASEFMTAIWNGFQVNKRAAQEGMQVYDEYADKLAAVAASTASDVTEQATAMSKVASAANQVGVGFDQLNAIMATTESVTRQAPETIGTAWRTIFSRITDLKLNGEDEEGVSLGDVSGQLSGYGIEILDKQTGDLRELGQVIDEIGQKWNNWTVAQQTAVAELIAGKRQYNNVTALFSEWNGMYQEALATSETGVGKLQEMQDIYMESNAAIRQQFKTAWEELYSDAFDINTVNDFYKAMTGVVNLIDGLVKSLGGAVPIFTAISGFFTQIISNKLAVGLGDIMNRWQSSKLQLENAREALQLVRETQQISDIDKDASEILDFVDKFTTKQQFMSDVQKQILRNLVEEKKDVQDLNNEWQKRASNIVQGSNGELSNIDDLKYAGDAFLVYQDHINHTIENLKDLREGLGETQQELRELDEEEKRKGYQEVREKLDAAGIGKDSDIWRTFVQSSGNAQEVTEAVTQAVEEELEKYDQLAEQLNVLPDEYREIKEQQEAIIDGGKNLAGQMENAIKIQPIIQGAGAMVELSSGIYSLSNSFNILVDSSSTLQEKIMSLTTIMLSFKSIIYSLGNLKGIGQLPILSTFEKGYEENSKKRLSRESLIKEQEKSQEALAKIEEKRQQLNDQIEEKYKNQEELRRRQQDIETAINEKTEEINKLQEDSNKLQEELNKKLQKPGPAIDLGVEENKRLKILDAIKRKEEEIESLKQKEENIDDKINDDEKERLRLQHEYREQEEKRLEAQEQLDNIISQITEIDNLPGGISEFFDNIKNGIEQIKEAGMRSSAGLMGSLTIIYAIVTSINNAIGYIHEQAQEAAEKAKENYENAKQAVEQGESRLESLRAERDSLLQLKTDGNELTTAEKERLEAIKEEIEEQKQQQLLLEQQEELQATVAAEAELAATNIIDKTDIFAGAINSIKWLFFEVKQKIKELLIPLAQAADLMVLVTTKGAVETNFEGNLRTAQESDQIRKEQYEYELNQASSAWTDREKFGFQQQRLQELDNQRKEIEEKRSKAITQEQREQYDEQLNLIKQYYNQVFTITTENYNRLKQAYEDSEVAGIPDEELKQYLDNYENYQKGIITSLDKQKDAAVELSDAWANLSETTKKELTEAEKNGSLSIDKIQKYFGTILDGLELEEKDAIELVRRLIKDSNIEVENGAQETYTTLKTLNGEISQTYDEFASFWGITNNSKNQFKGLTNSAKEYAEILKTLKSRLSLVGDAIKEQNKNGSISAETAVRLIDSNEGFAKALEFTTTGIKLKTEALKQELVVNLESLRDDYEKIQTNKTIAKQDLDKANKALQNVPSVSLNTAGSLPFKQWLKDNKDNFSISSKTAEIIGDNWTSEMAVYFGKFNEAFGVLFDNETQAKNVWTSIKNKWPEYVRDTDEAQKKSLEEAQKAAQAAYDAIDTTGLDAKISVIDNLIPSILNGTAFTGSSSNDKKHTKQIAEKYRNLLGEDIDVIQNEIKNYEDKLKRIQEQIADAIKNGDYELAQKLSGDYDTLANAEKQRKAELAKRYRAILSEMYADILEDLRKNGVPIPEEITDLESFFVYLPKLQGNIEQYYNQMEQRLEEEIAELKSAENVDNDAVEAKERELNNIKFAREAATSNISNAKELYDLVGTKEGEGSLAEQFKKDAEQQQKNWQDVYQELKNNIDYEMNNIDYEITELNNEMSSLEPTQYTEKFALQNKILELNKQKLAEVAKYQQWLDENRDAVGLKYYNEQTRANNKELQALNKTLQDNVKALKDQAKAMRDAAIALEDSVAQAWDKEMQNQFDATEKLIDAEERLLKKREKAIDEAKKALQKYLKALEDSWKAEDAHEERKKKLEERAEKTGERATQLTAAASGDLAALAQIRDLDKELKSMDEEMQQDIIEDIRDSFKRYIEDIETNWDEALEKEQKIIDNQKEALEDEKRNWTETMRTPEFWTDVIRVAQGGTANVNGIQMSYADMITSGYQWEGKGGTEEAHKGISEAVRTQGSVIEGWYNNPDKDTLEYYISTPLDQLRESIDALNTTLEGKIPLATYTLGQVAANIAGQATSGTAPQAALETLSSDTSGTILGFDYSWLGEQLANMNSQFSKYADFAAQLLENIGVNQPVSLNIGSVVTVEGDVTDNNIAAVRKAGSDSAYDIAKLFNKQFNSQGITGKTRL